MLLSFIQQCIDIKVLRFWVPLSLHVHAHTQLKFYNDVIQFHD